MGNCNHRPHRHGGFTYVGLLLLLALMSVALVATTELVSTSVKRDREEDLLFIGTQFVKALESYRSASSGAQENPRTLTDLLTDKRQPNVRRHLRRIYVDPMTGNTDWGVVLDPQERISGIYSKSSLPPLKKTGFPEAFASFGGAVTYADWRFIPLGELSSDEKDSPNKGSGSANEDGGPSNKKPPKKLEFKAPDE